MILLISISSKFLAFLGFSSDIESGKTKWTSPFRDRTLTTRGFGKTIPAMMVASTEIGLFERFVDTSLIAEQAIFPIPVKQNAFAVFSIPYFEGFC
jgi:hypothetical protein